MGTSQRKPQYVKHEINNEYEPLLISFW